MRVPDRVGVALGARPSAPSNTVMCPPSGRRRAAHRVPPPRPRCFPGRRSGSSPCRTPADTDELGLGRRESDGGGGTRDLRRVVRGELGGDGVLPGGQGPREWRSSPVRLRPAPCRGWRRRRRTARFRRPQPRSEVLSCARTVLPTTEISRFAAAATGTATADGGGAAEDGPITLLAGAAVDCRVPPSLFAEPQAASAAHNAPASAVVAVVLQRKPDISCPPSSGEPSGGLAVGQCPQVESVGLDAPCAGGLRPATLRRPVARRLPRSPSGP